MKILVRVEFFAGGIRPIITLCLRSENPSIFGFINAIIDTGSPTTIIGGADVQRLRISQIQMQKFIGEEKEVNLGGAQLKTRILLDADITVGGKKHIKLPIQVPVKIIKGTPPPSIVGIDFLLAGKFKFFFDPNSKEAYLETED